MENFLSDLLGTKTNRRTTQFLDPYAPEDESGENTPVQRPVEDASKQPLVVEKKEGSKSLPPVPQLKKKGPQLDDDWIVTPGFVQNTRNDKQKAIERLQSANESIRLSETNEIKVTVAYDEIFGLSILSDLFSIFSEASIDHLSTLEILKIIYQICYRSRSIVQMDYTGSFYTCLKILEKRGEISKWNDSHMNGKLILSVILDLLKLFELTQDSSDENWELCLPIIVQLHEITFPVLIQHYVLKFTKKFNKEDVSRVISLFCKKYSGNRLDRIIKVFFMTHRDQVEKYQQDLIGELISVSSLQYFYSISLLHPESVIPYYEKIKFHTSDIHLLECFVKISTEMVFFKPILVLDYLDEIHDCYLKNESHYEHLSDLIYFYGVLGRAIDSEKFTEKILNFLMDVLTTHSRKVVAQCLKAIGNICEKKPEMLHKVEILKKFRQDHDPDVRKFTLDLFVSTVPSDLEVKLMNLIDKQNLKIAELTLEIQKMKQ